MGIFYIYQPPQLGYVGPLIIFVQEENSPP
jgi:hypothetical protein